METTDERRAWHRWPVTMQAQLEAGDLRVSGEIRDFSRGGVLFVGHLSLAVGEVLRLTRPRMLSSTPVRIVRSTPNPDGTFSLGMRFDGPGPMPGTP